MSWQPIETAPRDGTAIQARIPGHGSDNIIAWHGGLEDEAGMECSTWCFVTEQEPPDDWSEGWCWEVNEDGCRSQPPTHWKPLPDEDLAADARVGSADRLGSANAAHDGCPVHHRDSF